MKWKKYMPAAIIFLWFLPFVIILEYTEDMPKSDQEVIGQLYIFVTSLLFIYPIFKWTKRRQKSKHWLWLAFLGIGIFVYLAVRYGRSPARCPACSQVIAIGCSECPQCDAPIVWPCPLCKSPDTKVIMENKNAPNANNILGAVILFVMGIAGLSRLQRLVTYGDLYYLTLGAAALLAAVIYAIKAVKVAKARNRVTLKCRSCGQNSCFDMNDAVPALPEIAFACPHCGQSLEAQQEMKGLTLTCPACEKEIIVPA